MQNAPLVVVVLAHKQAYLDRYGEPEAETTWPAPYWFIDAGMAVLLMLLTAVAEGLGTCFFGIETTSSGRCGRSSASPTNTRQSVPSRSGTGPPTSGRRTRG